MFLPKYVKNAQMEMQHFHLLRNEIFSCSMKNKKGKLLRVSWQDLARKKIMLRREKSVGIKTFLILN